MSPSLPTPTFRTTLRTFAQAPERPLGDLLTEHHIQAACDELGVAYRFFDNQRVDEGPFPRLSTGGVPSVIIA